MRAYRRIPPVPFLWGTRTGLCLCLYVYTGLCFRQEGKSGPRHPVRSRSAGHRYVPAHRTIPHKSSFLLPSLILGKPGFSPLGFRVRVLTAARRGGGRLLGAESQSLEGLLCEALCERQAFPGSSSPKYQPDGSRFARNFPVLPSFGQMDAWLPGSWPQSSRAVAGMPAAPFCLVSVMAPGPRPRITGSIKQA